jgi:hypothetical protein
MEKHGFCHAFLFAKALVLQNTIFATVAACCVLSAFLQRAIKPTP